MTRAMLLATARTSHWWWTMRSSKPLQVLLLCAFIALGGRGQAEDLQTAYIPFVKAMTSSGDHEATFWESTVGLYNAVPSTGTYAVENAFGSYSLSPSESNGTIPPASGRGFQVGPGVTWDGYTTALGFLLLRTSPGMVVQSDVQLVHYYCNVCTFGCAGVPQGSAPTPVYRSLFPAGSKVMSGAVELGYLDLASGCAPLEQKYLRRVNVTLLNAGAVPASFLIEVLPARGTTGPLSKISTVVAPGDVVQLNRIAVPTQPQQGLAFTGIGNYRVWITITADQPFLSYVSTVFDDPEPGALPFQVYPSYLQN